MRSVGLRRLDEQCFASEYSDDDPDDNGVSSQLQRSVSIGSRNRVGSPIFTRHSQSSVNTIADGSNPRSPSQSIRGSIIQGVIAIFTFANTCEK